MLLNIKDALLVIYFIFFFLMAYTVLLSSMVERFAVTEHWGTTRPYHICHTVCAICLWCIIPKEGLCRENNLLFQHYILSSESDQRGLVAMFSLKIDALRLNFKNGLIFCNLSVTFPSVDLF